MSPSCENYKIPHTINIDGDYVHLTLSHTLCVGRDSMKVHSMYILAVNGIYVLYLHRRVSDVLMCTGGGGWSSGTMHRVDNDATTRQVDS